MLDVELAVVLVEGVAVVEDVGTRVVDDPELLVLVTELEEATELVGVRVVVDVPLDDGAEAMYNPATAIATITTRTAITTTRLMPLFWGFKVRLITGVKY